MFTKSQDSSATEFPNALMVKNHLKQVDQIVHLIFSTKIMVSLLKFWQMFALLIKKKKFGIAVHYCLSLIG